MFQQLKWIISGEGHSEDWIDEDIVETPEFKNIFPEYSHWCIFTIHERQIVSIVSFYGFSTRKFVIGELPYNSSFPLIGLICDWKNKKEMIVDEFVYVQIHYSLRQMPNTIEFKTDTFATQLKTVDKL